MRQPDDVAAADAAFRHVVPRWSAGRSRRNLLAIRGRIVRGSRRGYAITLALAGVALFAGTVAVAAVVRLRAPEPAADMPRAAAPASRGAAKHGNVASRPAEPSTIEASPGAAPAPEPAAVTRPVPAPDVEALMQSADASRRAGRPAQAVPYLRRLLRDHPGDSRAPLAAFTLGRILLAELGQPTEAADAFALSRRLAPRGPMASHALAREVEAAARGGDGARARRLAETYLAQYSDGPQLAAVRRHGGIE